MDRRDLDTPPGEIPPPPPYPPPTPDLGYLPGGVTQPSRGRLAVSVAVAVVVLLLAGGRIWLAFGHPGVTTESAIGGSVANSLTPGPAPTPAPVSQQDPWADADLQSLSQLTDLTGTQRPPGWVACCPEEAYTGDDAKQPSTCLPGVDFAAQTALDVRQYALGLQPNGAFRVRLQVEARSTGTAAQTEAIYAEIDSPTEVSCVVSNQQEELHSFVGDAGQVATPTVTAVDLHLPVRGFTRRIALPFRNVNDGTQHIFFSDVVTMVAARYRVTLRFMGWMAAGATADDWQRAEVPTSGEPGLIQTLGTRLATLASAGGAPTPGVVP